MEPMTPNDHPESTGGESDIVKRLRERAAWQAPDLGKAGSVGGTAHFSIGYVPSVEFLLSQAANEIERLRRASTQVPGDSYDLYKKAIDAGLTDADIHALASLRIPSPAQADADVRRAALEEAAKAGKLARTAADVSGAMPIDKAEGAVSENAGLPSDPTL